MRLQRAGRAPRGPLNADVRRLLAVYGVPSDLPVSDFVGQEISLIGIGMHQIQLHFSGGGHIAIEGSWKLHERSGAIVDQRQETSDRDAYRIHRLLMQRVTEASVDAPRSFSLTFENGDRLVVSDDSPRYESFTIRLGERDFIV